MANGLLVLRDSEHLPRIPAGERIAIRVVLADNHETYLSGLVRAFSAHSDVEVVGEARDGRQALALIRARRPDVALIDMRMPELDGLEVLEAIDGEALETRIVFISAYLDGALVNEALDAGASGYVSKDSTEGTIVAAVRKVAAGELVVSDDLRAAVGDHLRGERDAASASLSSREREILARLASGDSGPDIAAALHLSPDTVKTYIRRACSKLGVPNAAAAIAEAVRRGLID